VNKIHKQFPGQVYTFRNKRTGETDAGILPDEYGQGNDFALWHKGDSKQGGHWASRKFANRLTSARRAGTSLNGLIDRMRVLHSGLNWIARRDGATALSSSPEEMLKQWETQNGICVACNKPGLSLFHSGAVYDHNHVTGEGRGFIHASCNRTEGYLNGLSEDEFLHFVKWMRPHIFKESVNVGCN
jgi:hypothetical protein